MLSTTWDRLLLACLVSLTLSIANAHAQPQDGSGSRNSTYGGRDTFAQPFDDTPAADGQGDQFYAPDDTTTPESYVPENYSPEDGNAQDTGFAGGYSESDFTGDGYAGYGGYGGGLEEAYVPGHAAPKYWLPEVHHNCAGCDACFDPWFVQAEAVMMHRNRSRAIVTTTTTEAIDTGGVEPFFFDMAVMNTKAASFQVKPGTRLTIGRYLGKDYIGRDHTLELTYLGVAPWKGSRSITGSRLAAIISGTVFEFGELNSPFSQTGQAIGSFASGFSNADTHSYQMHSELHNVELNWRVRRADRRDALVASPDGSWSEDYTPSLTPSLLFGLRYLNFDDEITWNSSGVITADGVPEAFSGQYNVETTNSMLGFQTGVEIRHQWRRFSWSVRAKVGLYGTSLDQDSTILVNDDTTLHAGVYPTENQHFGADTVSIGFIGELGLLLRYRLSPHCTLRGGYDFNWVVGLALAPEQMTFANPHPAKVNDHGDLLFQGARLGLEYVW